jgi:FkbM family methyltransferase
MDDVKIMNKKFWTLDKSGNEILRDLKKENENFTFEKYLNGEFDANNYQWFEMFHSYIHDDNGCDYERKGCYIKEGDVVLDIGANIGVFAHRAELRGASKVICFEPMTPTFNCLIKNAGPKTSVYKMAVGETNKFVEFKIHSDYTFIGGASTDNQDHLINERDIIHRENVYFIGINEIFNNELSEKFDFMKIDIEGGEVELLNAITDDNLNTLRCVSCEFHKTYEEFEDFQNKFWDRMMSLGFKGFIVFHGNGNLRTLTFWKD